MSDSNPAGREVAICKQFRFEAAHYLPKVPEGHKCRRMHGHSWKFDVICRGPIDPDTGWFIDFGDISRVVKPIVEQYLDHYCLNDIQGLDNPTSEILCVWLWDKIKPDLPELAEIVVYETCTSSCTFSGV
ncbi:MAG: 6-carboxytetrahydropterin synthase QueD [Leptospiraceae bacterium]|nr:6-carboxytetrahydropterin synthase QueD [Leptospiraceae bacterium]